MIRWGSRLRYEEENVSNITIRALRYPGGRLSTKSPGRASDRSCFTRVVFARSSNRESERGERARGRENDGDQIERQPFVGRAHG